MYIRIIKVLYASSSIKTKEQSVLLMIFSKHTNIAAIFILSKTHSDEPYMEASRGDLIQNEIQLRWG